MGAQEQLDRLDYYLDLWKSYSENGSHYFRLGYPHRSPVFSSGGYSKSLDELLEGPELSAAKAVDTIIDGMSPAPKAALLHNYKIAVFRFPRGNYRELLDMAKDVVRAGMIKRGFPF